MPTDQRARVLGVLETFGIPLDTFAAHELLERHKTYVIVRHSAYLSRLASFKVHHVGLPILRKIRHHLKPTTAALQHFGHLATRHIVDLPSTECQALLQYHRLAWDAPHQPGYVILRSEGHILGCGLYTPGLLQAHIPRRYLQHLHLPFAEAELAHSRVHPHQTTAGK